MSKKLKFATFSVLCVALVSVVILNVFAITQIVLGSDFSLTYTPVKVGDILEFGEYPQSYVGASLNNTLISLRNAGNLTATGKTYTSYFFQTSTAYTEYSYNGSKYVYVPTSKFWDGSEEPDTDPNKGKYGDTGAKFSTGESAYAQDTAAQGKPYFFKVEPIKFRVMATNFGAEEITVESVKSIGSMAFNRSSGTNVWANSDMRKFLNGAFLTDSGIDKFAKQKTIKNNVTGNYNNGGGVDTTDYVYIASINDLQSWWSNSSLTVGGSSADLTKAITDFAMATYGRNFKGTGNTYYGLRNAGTASNTICWVSYASPAKITATNTSFVVTGSDLGYAPVFTVKLT